jgi:hypothetical protein
VRGDKPRFSWTVIATAEDRFSDFAPYVASVNDEATVAFQAALRGGGAGVFTGNGGAIKQLVGPDLLAGVTSHPDRNESGATCFYGTAIDGAEGVFLLHEDRLRTIASTRDGFALIGPLGPTMNEAGTVAFRAEQTAGVSGIFAGDGTPVARLADTGRGWKEFYGLPAIDGRGTVVFRADRDDGVQGIYAATGESIEAIVETGDHFETIALFPSTNEGGTVAFAATLRAGGAGIFTATGDDVVQALDTQEGFESYRGALINTAGDVVFTGTPRGGTLGLFTGPDPHADRLLALGDALFSSSVADLAANPVSVNAHGHVAVRATLADGRQFIMRSDPVDVSRIET